jgi:hypothetical protein
LCFRLTARPGYPARCHPSRHPSRKSRFHKIPAGDTTVMRFIVRSHIILATVILAVVVVLGKVAS